MPKKRHPDWTYRYSELFKEEFAIHKETGWVFFSTSHGLVKYSPGEINIIGENGGQLELAIHSVKSIIGGEVVRYEEKRIDNKKCGIPDNAIVATENEQTAHKRDGELDIY